MQDRGYGRDYNSFFSLGLRQFFGDPKLTIASALARIAREDQPLEILEDGAGDGVFLSELKEELSKLGVKSRATALNLGHSEELEIRKSQGLIDEVVYGPAEFFVPKRFSDAIISMFGSIQYTQHELRKEHLLKFAESLRKSGLLMVGINQVDEKHQGRGSISRLLEHKPAGTKMTVEQEMHAIERAFEKRGFKAKFYEVRSHYHLPNWMLIASRLN